MRLTNFIFLVSIVLSSCIISHFSSITCSLLFLSTRLVFVIFLHIHIPVAFSLLLLFLSIGRVSLSRVNAFQTNISTNLLRMPIFKYLLVRSWSLFTGMYITLSRGIWILSHCVGQSQNFMQPFLCSRNKFSSSMCITLNSSLRSVHRVSLLWGSPLLYFFLRVHYSAICLVVWISPRSHSSVYSIIFQLRRKWSHFARYVLILFKEVHIVLGHTKPGALFAGSIMKCQLLLKFLSSQFFFHE